MSPLEDEHVHPDGKTDSCPVSCDLRAPGPRGAGSKVGPGSSSGSRVDVSSCFHTGAEFVPGTKADRSVTLGTQGWAGLRRVHKGPGDTERCWLWGGGQARTGVLRSPGNVLETWLLGAAGGKGARGPTGHLHSCPLALSNQSRQHGGVAISSTVTQGHSQALRDPAE